MYLPFNALDFFVYSGLLNINLPLSTLQVHLQTQQGKLSLLRLTSKIVKEQGVTALYNGLSASLCRQLTYSTARFGIYEASALFIYLFILNPSAKV